MNKNLARFSVGLALAVPAHSVFSFGYPFDIPVTLRGYLAIKGAGATDLRTCEITLAGNTNSPRNPATFTAVEWQGSDSCASQSRFQSAGVRWSLAGSGASNSYTLNNISLSSESGDFCAGSITLYRDPGFPGQLMINKQLLGTCTIDGVLSTIPILSLP
jgi:hypothetical protein